MRIFNLYILAVLVFTTSVQAREEFWYVGAGGGITSFEDRDGAFDKVSNKGSMAKAYVGYRASTFVALELDYAYLGAYDYTRNTSDGIVSDTLKSSALSFCIVVMYPLDIGIDGIELFTPVGGSLIKNDYGNDDEIISAGKLGFGIAYNPTKHLTIRVGADLNIYKVETFVDVDTTTDLTINLLSTYATLQYNF